MPGEHWDSEWGAEQAFSNRTSGPWCEYSYEAVKNEILRRAQVSDLSPIRQAAKEALTAFDPSKNELLPTLDALLSSHDDSVLREIRQKIIELKSYLPGFVFVESQAPHQIITCDSLASSQGRKVPHHIRLQAWLMELQSYGTQTKELAKIARHAERYLRQKHKMKGKTVAKTDGKIFIGHGHSSVWRELKDFIQDRLKLDWDEFNREPVAGFSTKERLEQMLDDACFAFLVMTAEDEYADGTKHARENVIHEAGLFQGRLTFQRAIILLEEGCAEFSNFHGIGQLRFPRGNIKAVFDDVRQTLEREGLIK